MNLGNAGIDPNRTFFCKLNNHFKKENNDNKNLPNCKYRDKLFFQS